MAFDLHMLWAMISPLNRGLPQLSRVCQAPITGIPQFAKAASAGSAFLCAACNGSSAGAIGIAIGAAALTSIVGRCFQSWRKKNSLHDRVDELTKEFNKIFSGERVDGGRTFEEIVSELVELRPRLNEQQVISEETDELISRAQYYMKWNSTDMYRGLILGSDIERMSSTIILLNRELRRLRRLSADRRLFCFDMLDKQAKVLPEHTGHELALKITITACELFEFNMSNVYDELSKAFMMVYDGFDELGKMELISTISQQLKVSGRLLASHILRRVVTSMKREDRTGLLVETVKQGRDASAKFLGLIGSFVSRDDLSRIAEASGDERLKDFIRYSEADIPFLDYLWTSHLNADDPKQYILDTAANIDEFRRGKILRRYPWLYDMMCAFAGLDSPQGLSYELFRYMLNDTPPPKPFVETKFTERVRSIRSVHATVDKGVLGSAVESIMNVRDVHAFQEYVRRIYADRSYRSVHGVLVEHLGYLKSATRKDIVGRAKRLVKKLWNAPRRNTQHNNLIANLVIFIAWQGENKIRRNMIAAAHGENPSSDVLWRGLNAAEEFYRSTVKDVMRKLIGRSGEEIRILNSHVARLKNEVTRAQREMGDEVEVEFIPSKSQTDRFFGFVSEDCNKDMGAAIDRPDFQVYRMISGKKLVGMIYLQKAELDGQKILAMGIEPRSSWQIDHRDLLRKIETNFSRIARDEGFDALMMMNDEHQTTNRQDMLSAIVERGYRVVTFNDRISGAIFLGNEFLAMWER